jgi:hypothetical protein
MEWEPEQQDLGGLGFAGICRETYRVGIRASLINKKGCLGAAVLSALLLAHAAALLAYIAHIDFEIDHGFDLVRIVVASGPWCLLEILCLCLPIPLAFGSTAAYVFSVASLYCTNGDSGATDSILRELPRAPLARLFHMFLLVIPLAMAYITYAFLACLLLPDIHATSNEVIVRLLQVLGSTACVASASYVAVLSHLSCVVAVLEDAVLCGAVRKSRALLAGKLWAASAVFVLLDGCFIAIQISFIQLVLENPLGLGLWFRVAAGAAIAVALWAVVVLTLVAQPVVYLVCKNHHHEVVDKVHLNYAGEYQRLAVNGDRGVELQPVTTAEIAATA